MSTTTEVPRMSGRLTGRNLQVRCDHDVVLTASCDDCRTAQQPAPDSAGGWRVIRPAGRPMTAQIWDGPYLIARELKPEHAAQIVRDHSAVPKLVEALKGVAIMLNTELEKYDSEPWAKRVHAALASTQEKQ